MRLIFAISILALTSCAGKPTQYDIEFKARMADIDRRIAENRIAEAESAAKLAKERERFYGWQSGCTSDRVTNAITCFTTKFFAAPGYPAGPKEAIRVSSYNRQLLCISFGLHSHPGAIGVVRIGANQPYTYKQTICGKDADMLIRQMHESQEGASRSVAWPSDYHEIIFSTAGFGAGYEELRQLIAHPVINRPPG